jgi:hypothetical protein
MIDFTLTENDKAQLARTRAEALICRKYAREYEEREELPPDELPERKEFLASAEAVPEPGPEDSPRPVMMALHAMGAYWGDYSIRLKQSGGGLGNAALTAAGTKEQQEKWGHLTLPSSTATSG